MCRNIRTLFNFEPPATEDEIHKAVDEANKAIRERRKERKGGKGQLVDLFLDAHGSVAVEISAARQELLGSALARLGRNWLVVAGEFLDEAL